MFTVQDFETHSCAQWLHSELPSSHHLPPFFVRNLKVIEVKDRTMKEDPDKKYRMDKTLMMETYDRGEIQLMERTCNWAGKTTSDSQHIHDWCMVRVLQGSALLAYTI